MSVSVRASGAWLFPDGSKRSLTCDEMETLFLKSVDGKSTYPYTVLYVEDPCQLEGYYLKEYNIFRAKGLKVAFICWQDGIVGIVGYVE